MMKKSENKISRKIGSIPGTLIHIGKKGKGNVKVSSICYNESHLEEKVFDANEAEFDANSNNQVKWINVDGIHQVNTIDQIGQAYHLHPLLLEDVLNTYHRPKVESFDKYLLFTLKMLGIDAVGKHIISEQVSFVLGKNYLISFQEREGDLFEPIRDRIRSSKGKIRKKGADYLLYSLIDAVVDNYFLVMEHFSEKTENLEEEVFENPDEKILKKIHTVKKQLAHLRKSIYPLREAISSIIKEENTLVINDTNKYFRDIYDHTIHIIENIESQRDVVSGIKDLYSSEQSNRMNNIMKVLTIIATIFIPLTFVAGIYGMNFENMPELKWEYGYLTVWLLMLTLFVGMIYYFKKKRWL